MDYIQLIKWICLVVGIILGVVAIFLMIKGSKATIWLLLSSAVACGGFFALRSPKISEQFRFPFQKGGSHD